MITKKKQDEEDSEDVDEDDEEYDDKDDEYDDEDDDDEDDDEYDEEEDDDEYDEEEDDDEYDDEEDDDEEDDYDNFGDVEDKENGDRKEDQEVDGGGDGGGNGSGGGDDGGDDGGGDGSGGGGGGGVGGDEVNDGGSDDDYDDNQMIRSSNKLLTVSIIKPKCQKVKPKCKLEFIAAVGFLLQTSNTLPELLNMMKLPQDDLNEIKEKTKEQSDNSLWRILRQGRITASSFGKVQSPTKGVRKLVIPDSSTNQNNRQLVTVIPRDIDPEKQVLNKERSQKRDQLKKLNRDIMDLKKKLKDKNFKCERDNTQQKNEAITNFWKQTLVKKNADYIRPKLKTISDNQNTVIEELLRYSNALALLFLRHILSK